MPLNTIPNSGLTSRGYPSDRLVTPIIINGDMSVSQRATSEASVSSIKYSACDRWYTNPQNIGTYTISQSTEVPTGQGFAKSYKVDCTTADASPSAGDIFQIQQRIEGQNLQILKKGTSSAESTTLSFWVKSNLTATFGVTLQDNDNSRIIGSTFAISSADTWEKKVISLAGDTTGALDNDNANSLQLQFCLGTGSTYTGTDNTSWGAYANAKLGNGVTGNIASSTSNEFYLTGVQLEVGDFDSTTIPSFPFESFESNLSKCRRYLQYVCGTSNIGELTGGFRATGSAQCGMQFTTPMRAAPSVSLVGLRLHDLNDGDNLDVTSIGVVNGSSSNGTWLNMNNSGTGTVAGVCILYGYNASPTSGVQSYGIKVDAEL